MSVSRLYHGTRVSNVSSISLNGLFASTGGRLGPGLYLATLDSAQLVAEHRGNGTGFAVLEIEVDLGKVRDTGTADDGRGSWFPACDTATGTHPSWAGNVPFQEWCVRDVRRCRIVAVNVIGGVVDGNLNLPGVVVRTRGNVTFTGDVTAKTIIIG